MKRLYDISLEDWQDTSWWAPADQRGARVTAGQAGHEHEIVVNFDFWYTDRFIPRIVEEFVQQEVPETWKVESRGTRLEVHPSGRYAGGWCEDDVKELKIILDDLGFQTTTVIYEDIKYG